jgi:hypothetical protein
MISTHVRSPKPLLRISHLIRKVLAHVYTVPSLEKTSDSAQTTKPKTMEMRTKKKTTTSGDEDEEEDVDPRSKIDLGRHLMEYHVYEVWVEKHGGVLSYWIYSADYIVEDGASTNTAHGEATRAEAIQHVEEASSYEHASEFDEDRVDLDWNSKDADGNKTVYFPEDDVILGYWEDNESIITREEMACWGSCVVMYLDPSVSRRTPIACSCGLCKYLLGRRGCDRLHEEVRVVVVLTRILLVGSNSMASSAPASGIHVGFSSDTIFVV